MPEGDTVHRAARRLNAALAGHVPDAVLTPQRRHAHEHWDEKVGTHEIERVFAHGKHLFIEFANGLVIHSHLGMSGSWRVLTSQSPVGRSLRRAWIVIQRDYIKAVEFDGPTLELVSRLRASDIRRQLGPDILAPDFAVDTVLARLPSEDQTRPLGDVFLDQRVVAGIGNMWKVEACFDAEVSPWRALGETSSQDARRVLMSSRRLMLASLEGRRENRDYLIYRKESRPCPRCGPEFRIQARGQGDNNRLTFWCSNCQR